MRLNHLTKTKLSRTFALQLERQVGDACGTAITKHHGEMESFAASLVAATAVTPGQHGRQTIAYILDGTPDCQSVKIGTARQWKNLVNYQSRTAPVHLGSNGLTARLHRGLRFVNDASRASWTSILSMKIHPRPRIYRPHLPLGTHLQQATPTNKRTNMPITQHRPQTRFWDGWTAIGLKHAPTVPEGLPRPVTVCHHPEEAAVPSPQNSAVIQLPVRSYLFGQAIANSLGRAMDGGRSVDLRNATNQRAISP